MIKVNIPSQLRGYSGNKAVIETEGATVQQIIDELIRQHPQLKDRLLDENNKLRRFVNIFLGDEDIRFLDNMATALKPGDELSIIPAIAGGAR